LKSSNVDGVPALTGRAFWKANDEPTVAETMAAKNTAEIQGARGEVIENTDESSFGEGQSNITLTTTGSLYSHEKFTEGVF